jgi:hypothetical protein
MKTLPYCLSIIILFCYLNNTAFAQKETLSSTAQILSYLIGDWTGEGSGKPGEGTGYFSFSYYLDSNIIIRKSHSEYPPSKDRPSIIHDDLLIIYKESSDSFNKAIYFDNEEHIIHYYVTVSDDNESIIFSGERSVSQPTFRLTYRIIDDNKVNVIFEYALPEKPDSFKTYIAGTSIRKK